MIVSIPDSASMASMKSSVILQKLSFFGILVWFSIKRKVYISNKIANYRLNCKFCIFIYKVLIILLNQSIQSLS